MLPRAPADEREAQAVLEAHVAKLRDRGYDDLRRIAGEVKRRYLWGRLRLMDGPGVELDEAVGPSGALYHLATHVSWEAGLVGGDLRIEVELQEDAEPGGELSTSFALACDGTFSPGC